MTTKNLSAKTIRIRIGEPKLYELATLGDGTVIVREIDGPNQGVLITRESFVGAQDREIL
jgi:hypothetical protein